VAPRLVGMGPEARELVLCGHPDAVSDAELLTLVLGAGRSRRPGRSLSTIRCPTVYGGRVPRTCAPSTASVPQQRAAARLA